MDNLLTIARFSYGKCNFLIKVLSLKNASDISTSGKLLYCVTSGEEDYCVGRVSVHEVRLMTAPFNCIEREKWDPY